MKWIFFGVVNNQLINKKFSLWSWGEWEIKFSSRWVNTRGRLSINKSYLWLIGTRHQIGTVNCSTDTKLPKINQTFYSLGIRGLQNGHGHPWPWLILSNKKAKIAYLFDNLFEKLKKSQLLLMFIFHTRS